MDRDESLLIGCSQGDTRTFGESGRAVADVPSQAREDEDGGVGNARRVWKWWTRREKEAFQAIAIWQGYCGLCIDALSGLDNSADPFPDTMDITILSQYKLSRKSYIHTPHFLP